MGLPGYSEAPFFFWSILRTGVIWPQTRKDGSCWRAPLRSSAEPSYPTAPISRGKGRPFLKVWNLKGSCFKNVHLKRGFFRGKTFGGLKEI
tara:strand:- start:134 stop:406 length:273 start_codon:yes stop_codon:yes gene_type:complete